MFGSFLNTAIGVIFISFEGYRNFELIVVMIIVPFILNIIQFWITDTFLKHNTPLSGSSASVDRYSQVVELSNNLVEDDCTIGMDLATPSESNKVLVGGESREREKERERERSSTRASQGENFKKLSSK